MQCTGSDSAPHARALSPILKRLSADLSIVASRHQMAPQTKVAIDKGTGEQESLSLVR